MVWREESWRCLLFEHTDISKMDKYSRGIFRTTSSESGNAATILPHTRCRKQLKQNHFNNGLNHNNNCAYSCGKK